MAAAEALARAQAAWDAGDLEGCLASAEAGIGAPAPLGMTPQFRAMLYQLHVLAGRCLVKRSAGSESALAHFYLAKELDPTKMPALVGAAEALREIKGRGAELAHILSLQAGIAKSNGNAKKTVELYAQAAETYQLVSDWTSALRCWQSSDVSSSLVQLSIAKVSDAMGDWRAADDARWTVVNDPLADSALRIEAGRALASRPAQAVLDSRHPPVRVPDSALEIGLAAWEEFQRRVELLGDCDSCLRDSVRLMVAESLGTPLLNSHAALALSILRRPSSLPLAFQARAWSVLASVWFDSGDTVLAWNACIRAEDMEQASYLSPDRCAALSLVARRSPLLLLVSAKCLLLHSWKQGLRSSIGEANRRVAAGLAECIHAAELLKPQFLEIRAILEWMCLACTSNYMRCPPPQESSFEAPSQLVRALVSKDVAVLRALCSEGNPGLVRVIASRGLASLAIPCDLVEASSVDALARQEFLDLTSTSSLSLPPGDAALLTWSGLAGFLGPDSPDASALASLQEAVRMDGDGVPLALELLGRYFMGVRGLSLPHVQPPRSLVKDARQAVQLLGRAVAVDPRGEGAACILANALHAAGQDDKASSLYKTLLKARAGSIWAWTRLGQTQLRQRQAQAACASFQQAIAQDERLGGISDWSLQGWLGLGEAHYMLGRLSAASTAFERACELSPGEGVAWARLGRSRLESGDYEAAVDALEKSVGLLLQGSKARVARVDLAEALLSRGRQLRQLGAKLASQAYFERVVDTLHDSRPDKIVADALLELGWIAKATRAYQAVAHLEPWSSLAWYDLGRAGQVRCAAEAAVVLDPSDGLNWILLSRCIADLAKEQHCLVHSLHVEPSGSAWLALSLLFLRCEKPLLARRALGQAQSLEPDSSAAWTGHALASELLGEDSSAAFACAANSPGPDFIGHLGAARAMLRARNWPGLLKSAALARTRGAGAEATLLHARALEMHRQLRRAKAGYLEAATEYMQEGNVHAADCALLNAAQLMEEDEAPVRDTIAREAFARSGGQTISVTPFHLWMVRVKLNQGRLEEAERELDLVNASDVAEENSLLLLRCQVLQARGQDPTDLARILLDRLHSCSEISSLAKILPVEARNRLRREMWTNAEAASQCAEDSGLSPFLICALFPWETKSWSRINNKYSALATWQLMVADCLEETGLEKALNQFVSKTPTGEEPDLGWWASAARSKAAALLPWTFATSLDSCNA